MMVSTKGRYALRLMVDLALHDNGKFIALKDVSARQKISIKYLEQIVTPLNRAGLLKSGEGRTGRLPPCKKNTTDYTVGEILRAIEGSFAPISCLEDEENQCENYDTCATIEFWEGLYKVVNEYLDGTTLYDLVEIQKEKMGGNYYI